MKPKKTSNNLTRRKFVKNSVFGLSFLAAYPVLQNAEASDNHSWETVMGQPWKKPRQLDKFAGIHPRLFITNKKIGDLKQKITTTHLPIWEMVKEKADSYLGQLPPSDFESQGDMRDAGRGIPWQALAFLLTDKPEYLENAKKWVFTICSFPHWENNKSLAGGECLFGVAIGYDWLYQHFTVPERTLIREKLILQAEALKTSPVHHDVWLANHNHVEHNGLGAAGFALYDEVPEATHWIRQADLVFRQMLKTASADGSSNEGHQYWGYTTESVLRYLEMARDLLGSDYYNHAWLKRVSEFVINSITPDFNAENCIMTFGDSSRTFSSHGPTQILYRLAAEYRDPYAQWLALEMDRRNIGRAAYCTWANLLWYDETLKPVDLSSLPTSGLSDDVGWVTSRSRWADDAAIMVGFKCGPMHGHKVQDYYFRQYDEKWPELHSIGGGHGHADVNSFQVYGYGKWLAIDPGYERPIKTTSTHNTLLVNGKGQLGEGLSWFDRNSVIGNRATSRITKVDAKNSYLYTVGDAYNIYPAALGLTRFHRHFVYLKPDVIVLVDDLQSEMGCTVDWLLHTEKEFIRTSDRSFFARNEDVEMDVEILLPIQAETKLEGKLLKMTVAIKQQAFIVAVLYPRKGGAQPIKARADLSGGANLSVAVDQEDRRIKIDFNITRQEVKVSG